MLKSLKSLLRQDRTRYKVPRRVQDVIPVKRIWKDGIFLCGNCFTKSFRFTDINYSVADRENKERMLLEYAALLNGLDAASSTKITINNRRLSRANIEGSIEGTNIDYPVMQTVNEPDFYLKHGFDRSYSDYGVHYMQENCMAELSDNCVIYGHHMSDGTMFADLCRYADEGFYREHRTIRFDTLSEYGIYEIVSVFKTTAYTDDGFKYYRFVNAESREDFDAFLETCQMLSLYDTGVKAAYGDRLLTLSTCEYSTQNGRMVVVARKVNAENETAVDDE